MRQFKTEQFLPIDKKTAWAFFSSPKNLSTITPPELDFKILTTLTNDEIYEGMKIDYTVKPLFGMRLKWQTKICKVQNQNYFTDIQTIGPYKTWEHKHTFVELNNGVLMTDVVNYELPLGFIGKLVEEILVRKKIDSIFNYRRDILSKLFV
ncbi:MAG: SRPBCC family protein [Bacteroidetes bacterium]|nr:SRPBCC family protein [Bacteroidota bacterium]